MIPKNCWWDYPEWKGVHLDDENSRFIWDFPIVCQTCDYIGACMYKIIHQERTWESIEFIDKQGQDIAQSYLESMGIKRSSTLQ